MKRKILVFHPFSFNFILKDGGMLCYRQQCCNQTSLRLPRQRICVQQAGSHTSSLVILSNFITYEQRNFQLVQPCTG